MLQFRAVTKIFGVRPAARLLGLSFGAAQKAVFENLSETISAGEKLLVTGPNGSGKTTFLKLAAGLTLPCRGQVLLAGLPVQKANRKRLGVMLSNWLLYSTLTGLENLRLTAGLYGISRSEERIRLSLKTWGLEPFANRRVETYSNGMKSCLALARATLHSPDILFLDEPTAYLSLDNFSLLTNYLAAFDGTAVVTAQEQSGLVGFSDRVLRL